MFNHLPCLPLYSSMTQQTPLGGSSWLNSKLPLRTLHKQRPYLSLGCPSLHSQCSRCYGRRISTLRWMSKVTARKHARYTDALSASVTTTKYGSCTLNLRVHLFLCHVHCERRRRRRRKRKTARGRWCLGTQGWHNRSSNGVTRASRTKSSKLRCILMFKLSNTTLTPTSLSALPYWRHGRHSNKLTVQKQMWQRYRA